MIRDLIQLNTFHKKAIVALFCVLVVLLVSYFTFISRIMVQTVARDDINRSITEAAAELAFLEAEYMKAADALTLARAHDMGFVDASVSLFVSRRADSFSFRTDSN